MMKNKATLVLSFLALSLASCKKDKATESPTVTELVKNAVFTGDMKYNNIGLSEPFTIRFDETGDFEWNEFSGTYTGTYDVDNDARKINVNFDVGSSFTATISNDNELVNITYPGNYPWKIESAKLTTTSEQYLGSTTWTGITSGDPLSITFHTPFVLSLTKGSMIYHNINYTERYGTVRFSLNPGYLYFGAFTGINMHGINRFILGASGYGYQQWEVSKL